MGDFGGFLPDGFFLGVDIGVARDHGAPPDSARGRKGGRRFAPSILHRGDRSLFASRLTDKSMPPRHLKNPEALTSERHRSPHGGGALAGAAHYAAMSHGPVRLSDRDLSEMPAERREAMEETFLGDLMSAVKFYSELTMKVRYDEYDRDFEPELRAVVFATDTGPTVTPISGFRLDEG